MISKWPRRLRLQRLALLTVCTSLLSLSLLAARKPKEDGPAAQLRKAPPKVTSLKNPYEGQPEAVVAGKKLYLQNCAECHGRDARGLGRAANLHSSAVQKAPPGVLFWALRNGRVRKGMPSWSRLPDQQIWQIVTYLKTLK